MALPQARMDVSEGIGGNQNAVPLIGVSACSPIFASMQCVGEVCAKPLALLTLVALGLPAEALGGR